MFNFHHIGVITTDMAKSISFYEGLSYLKSEAFHDKIQDVEIVFMEKEDAPRVELVRPLSDKSPAYTWINRIQGGPYHSCYECSDIEEGIKEMEERGLSQVTEIESAIAFEGRSIVFMWNKNLGLIELLEAKHG
jgi:methylmalonyl-CoA/ethylmalonyl-CoA epimerase